MTIESIYDNHYRGETYRAGVAYLRASNPLEAEAPHWIGHESLDQQRQIIAEAARSEQTIIVAEFIDYGIDRGYRPAFKRMTRFAEGTHARRIYVVREGYLDHRSKWFSFLKHYLNECDLNLISAED